MDMKEVRRISTEGSLPIRVHLGRGKNDPAAAVLSDFFFKLTTSGGLHEFSDPIPEDSQEAPFLAFSSTGGPRNYYKALPSGLEWSPFLSLLRSLEDGNILLTPESKHRLLGLKRPLTIQVLITDSCPFCAQVVGLVNQVAAAGAQVRAWIIDLDLFPDYLQRYRPKAAPTTILEEEIILTGLIQEKELIEWLIRLDSNDYLDRLYRNHLMEKRMDEAWKRLLHHPQDLPIIAGLIRDEAFSIKLGAMALLEQVVDEAPLLHEALFQALGPLLEDPSDLVVGDGAYLLGLLPDPRKIPLLQALLNHDNPEIVEAAREGLKT